MSSRSIKKRRHREDFAEYVAGREKFENIASQWKNFGFPNKTLFIKALTDHAAKQATHIHDENCQHEVPVTEHVHGEGCTHHTDPLPQEVADKMTDEEWIDAPLTAEEMTAFANADLESGDNWNDNEAVRSNEAASDAEQIRLREGIEADLAADRANLDFLPDETK